MRKLFFSFYQCTIETLDHNSGVTADYLSCILHTDAKLTICLFQLREEGSATESFLVDETKAVIDIVKIAGQPALNYPSF
jgi:hypothetical protein